GADRVLEVAPIMGAEDFAFYTRRVPGCFLGLGVRNEAKGAVYPVHHPRFTLDEDALPIGAALHVALALKALAELRAKGSGRASGAPARCRARAAARGRGAGRASVPAGRDRKGMDLRRAS